MKVPTKYGFEIELRGSTECVLLKGKLRPLAIGRPTVPGRFYILKGELRPHTIEYYFPVVKLRGRGISQESVLRTHDQRDLPRLEDPDGHRGAAHSVSCGLGNFVRI